MNGKEIIMKTIDNSFKVVNDMPKLDSPFVREENENGNYVITDQIQEGYEWVFKNDNVTAIEKLDGTNVSLVIRDGHVVAVYNRQHRVPAFNKNKDYITRGVLNSMQRGYVNMKDGQWFGELVGPKVQGNPYDLDEHLWIPFQRYSWQHLEYKSWGKYPKTFKSISKWFKDGLIPLFYSNIHGVSFDKAAENCEPEGIVFTDPDTMKMAKIRYDMFNWYHK